MACSMPKLQSFMVLPGNAGLCGPIPAGINITYENGTRLTQLPQPVCPAAPAPAPVAATHAGSSNTGAAVGELPRFRLESHGHFSCDSAHPVTS